jgi:hypothetical protein
MSIFQAACLAVAAYSIVPVTFPLVHESYSLGLALRYALILLVSGFGFVSYGILISVVIEGGNWPAIIGASTSFLLLVLGQLVPGLDRYGPFAVLSGATYFRYGAIPWVGMCAGLAAASVMLALAMWIVKWQDF